MTTQPLIYEQSDIPPGMTCGEYRRRKLAKVHSSRSLARLARRGFGRSPLPRLGRATA